MSEADTLSQDNIEVHWQHPRHELERPVLLIWPNPLKENWAAEILADESAVVVCREVLWKDDNDDIRKYAERVDPLDKIPGYVATALRSYDSEYGPVHHIVNPVNESDDSPPADQLHTLQEYFEDDRQTGDSK